MPMSSRPTRLFLVRHGEVEGAGVRLHGHVDVELTARGSEQMTAVAERLRAEPLSAIYSSDLQRARLGAEEISRGRDVPVVEDLAFRELDMGDWDGRAMAELMEEQGPQMERWWSDLEDYVLPGGESLSLMRDRVLGALAGVLRRHPGDTVCLVAHGGVNRIILFEALGVPLAHFHRLAQDYGCLNLIEYHPDGNAVVRFTNR